MCVVIGPTWSRTRGLPVMSRWLNQLSYGPVLENTLTENSLFCQEGESSEDGSYVVALKEKTIQQDGRYVEYVAPCAAHVV